MLASSWAQIYCLYIRLSSKNRKKKIKKREFSKKGWVLSDHPGDRNLPKGYTEYFIPDTSSPLECQPGSLMLRAAPAKHRPPDGTNTLDGFPLVCELLSHRPMATILPKWAEQQEKREDLCLRKSQWCCCDLPKHSHCPAHSVRTKQASRQIADSSKKLCCEVV